jgi:choline kinase
MTPQFVILAAGMGTRLGKPHPKALTILDNGETIMARQIRNIRAAFGDKAQINIVVGFQLENIIDAFPDEHFIYNEEYDTTNTSKSLMRALWNVKKNNGVVWMNGDVVFDEDLLFYLKEKIALDECLITVNSDSVDEEEVKYTLDENGNISALSKVVLVEEALGESVGINFVNKKTASSLESWLKKVENQDYFEKAIEQSILFDKTEWKTFDITKLGLSAVEVDFAADLVKANKSLLLSN